MTDVKMIVRLINRGKLKLEDIVDEEVKKEVEIVLKNQ